MSARPVPLMCCCLPPGHEDASLPPCGREQGRVFERGSFTARLLGKTRRAGGPQRGLSVSLRLLLLENLEVQTWKAQKPYQNVSLAYFLMTWNAGVLPVPNGLTWASGGTTDLSGKGRPACPAPTVSETVHTVCGPGSQKQLLCSDFRGQNWDARRLWNLPETKHIVSGALNIDIFVLKLQFMAFKYMEPLTLGLIKYESKGSED